MSKWVGKCPSCGEWGTVDEAPAAASSGRPGAASVAPVSPAKRITEIDATAADALPTGIGELDRVLGTGVVPGSVVLLAGEPGVGKSTLLLETVKRWAFLPGELEVDRGEVTPSMKVRRAEVERRYRDLLDSLYDRD